MQILLLILASISVFCIGTGISLVHVDYKRQLVGSTIAQMGFMLIQCALGAYLAAIIHLVFYMAYLKLHCFCRLVQQLTVIMHHQP